MDRAAWLCLWAIVYYCPLSYSAELAHGLAMHGVPKYSVGFSHFDYVNCLRRPKAADKNAQPEAPLIRLTPLS